MILELLPSLTREEIEPIGHVVDIISNRTLLPSLLHRGVIAFRLQMMTNEKLEDDKAKSCASRKGGV